MDAQALREAGFVDVGAWSLEEGEIAFRPSPAYRDAPRLVYAFARAPADDASAPDEVVYIGSTDRTLAMRLHGYERPGPTQSTNLRIAGLIAETLAPGRGVGVLAAWPGEGEWNGLPVQLHRGLEAGLIAAWEPEWNLS